MSFADDWDHWARHFPVAMARGWRDFLEAIELLVREVTYNPDSLTLNTGTHTGGDIDSVQAMYDSDTYDVDEVAGVPGYDIQFAFSGVTQFNRIWLYLKYTGTASHIVDVQLYNYTTTSWVTISEFGTHDVFEFLNIRVPDDSDYIDSGDVLLKIYHETSGNSSDDITIDYVAVARAGVAIPA